MKNQVLKIAFVLSFLTSCVIQSPKYTTLKQVMDLQVGMSKAEVETILGVQPYDLQEMNDSSKVYIYVYRVTDRKTLSFKTNPVNGKEAIGKYVKLAVDYSTDGTVRSIKSCILCPNDLVTTRKLDFQKLVVFITITLPVLLVYFGLKN